MSCAARLITVIGALLLAFTGALAQKPATKPVEAADTGFSGEWETSYGLMRLTQKGDAVEGGYDFAPGTAATVAGKVQGRKLTFTYVEPNARGEGWFELAADGKSFKGKWRAQGMANWGDWEGVRRGAAGPPPGPFEGIFQTTYGRMRLWHKGDAVTGIYEFGGRSTLSGTAKDRVVTLKYEQPDGEKGEVTFTLAADGKSMSGTWKSSAGPDGKPGGPGGKWDATRLAAQPGKVYLVVLEAPWEANLAQQEYSFGLMLRTFFARVPQVEVRHRAIYSEKDLRRWAGELTYMAEPVVLYISSHGTEKGLSLGRDTVGAKAIAEAVRDCDLRLLHFGSCLIGGGDVPRQIFAELGPQARYPISGFKHTADWGGSAVIDFTYMDLVLGRGMSPAKAVEQTRKMLNFARDKSDPGDAIPAAGLTIFEPGK